MMLNEFPVKCWKRDSVDSMLNMLLQSSYLLYLVGIVHF